MASKLYVVLKGRGKTPATYHSWDECKEKVHGFEGAVYKSFKTKEEADKYIKNGPTKTKSKQYKRSTPYLEKGLLAFVDGSYSEKKNMYSYGVVLLKDCKVIHTMSGKGKDEEAASMHQIFGELTGAMKAVQWAIDHGEKSVHLFYDYYGIAKWANEEWKANKKHTKEYQEFMKKAKEQIEIKFTKVAAHTGDAYNEMADMLAKKALGIKPV